jgi:hypothetical protein
MVIADMETMVMETMEKGNINSQTEKIEKETQIAFLFFYT